MRAACSTKQKELKTKSLFNRSITSLDFVLKQDVEARCSQSAMRSNGSLGSLLKVCEFLAVHLLSLSFILLIGCLACVVLLD